MVFIPEIIPQTGSLTILLLQSKPIQFTDHISSMLSTFSSSQDEDSLPPQPLTSGICQAFPQTVPL